MATAWDDPEFVKVWNDTYGVDMEKAPIRGEFVFPWIESKVGNLSGKCLIDLGCGNGNLIRHFLKASYGIKKLVGVDSGEAVIQSAQTETKDSRASFVHASAVEEIDYSYTGQNFDVVTSIFVVEEIPIDKFQKYCRNVSSLMGRGTLAFVFTNHPVNALAEDLTSHLMGRENLKFKGHKGYFDSTANEYTLAVMNGARGHERKAAYHHKPLADILTAFAAAGLSLRSMVELPRGVKSLSEWQAHTPKSGDIPRFVGFMFEKN